MNEATNKTETFNDIINGDKPVLVDFFAEWCGPCKMMKPVLEDLRAKMGDDIRIIKVDIDKSPVASSQYNVTSVPTLMLFLMESFPNQVHISQTMRSKCFWICASSMVA